MHLYGGVLCVQFEVRPRGEGHLHQTVIIVVNNVNIDYGTY